MNEQDHELVQFYIDQISEYMKEDDFQEVFFHSLCEQYEERESLSPKQIDCLKRMYERVNE